MAFSKPLASGLPGQNAIARGVLSFTLEDGTTGIISPEERRTYDHIICTNVGVFPTHGLTDDQAKHILSRSSLSEADLDSIWNLTDMIVAEGFLDGCWTELEVYVALKCVQAHELLSLNQMATKFAGSTPPQIGKKIRRRSSYAQAGILLPPPSAEENPVPSIIPPVVARSVSFSSSQKPPERSFLRHTTSDTTTSGRMRRIQADRVLYNNDNLSVSQAGLEVINTIEELTEWGLPNPAPVPTITSLHINHTTTSECPDEIETLGRMKSIETDTAGRARRLKTLSRARCPEFPIEPDNISSIYKQPEASTLDRNDARDLLVRKRCENPKFKDPSSKLGNMLKSKEAKEKASNVQTWKFDELELSLALKEVVEVSGHVGVAKELIDMGADVNSYKQTPKGKLKAFRSDNLVSVPFNYMKVAASKNNVDMVSLLAIRGTLPESRVDALEQSVRQNLPNVVSALLQLGVDPNARDGSIFELAIVSQKPALVRLLLRSQKKIEKRLLTHNLLAAVSQGHLEIVSLLVTSGADVNFGHASAFRRAVQSQNIDLILYVMKGGIKSRTASSVIEEAFSASSSLSVPEQYLLVEILLCAGARGDPVAKTLVPVVRAGHRSIVKLLVMHGADLQYNNAEALRIAVSAADLESLDTLLLGKISGDCASILFDEIPLSCNDDQKYGLMSSLISKGAAGEPVDRALVQAVQRKSPRIIGLLLDHKASVDYKDAQALRMAVTGSDLAIVSLLLNKGLPQPESMQHVLPLIPQSPPRLRYDMTKLIIDTADQNRLPTKILNTALVKAVDPRSQDIDNGLADLLIAAGANVDCQQGKCFRLAAEGGSIRLLELLIKTMTDTTSLCAAVNESMKIKQPKVRRRFIAILLDHGVRGSDVDQALVDAFEEIPIDEALVRSFLEKADVNYHGGQALLTAVRCSSTKMVASIIDAAQTNKKSRLAALSILLEPGTNDRVSKLRLLLQAGIDQTSLDKALIQEISSGRNSDVISMLVDRKACCEYDGGKALELTITSLDIKLLEYLVATKPDRLILGKMIAVAMCNNDVGSRRMSIAILTRGGAKGSEISDALVQEVCSSHPDLQFVKNLVRHGASVDYREGEAIKFAVSKPLGIDFLRTLLVGTVALTLLPSLVRLVMAHKQDLRLPLLQVLLENGARGLEVDAALVAAVSEGAAAQATIDLLLQYEASVEFNNAEAIKIASSIGPPSILGCLLDRNPHPDYMPDALKLAMQAPTRQPGSKIPLRLHLVQLLTRKRITNLGVLHSALIKAVQEMDHALVEQLIQSGGDPAFRDGASVVTAAEQYDVKTLATLAKSSLTATICSNAFSAASQAPGRRHQEHETVVRIDDILLRGGAAGPAVDQTFLNALNTSHPLTFRFIHMILKYETPLDANFQDGKCLCICVRKGLINIVDYLLTLRPKKETLRRAFMTIFESDAIEENLIKLALRFFDHSKEAKGIYFEESDPLDNPLYQTLHRHGDKPNLLQILFDNGCRAESRFSWTFQPTIGAEGVSALLWFLCQGDKSVEGRTVKILLDRGADANFRTSISGNSPLIVAASSSQSHIVSQLLEAGAHSDTEDNICGTPLQYASEVGDLESMRHLLKYIVNVNDESLHVAARRFDVSAIKLLLDHDASIDWPGTRLCDDRTPLEEICLKADPMENPANLKNTLKTLAEANPDLQKLYYGRSLILLALDNRLPLLMTRKLIEAYPALKKNLNDDFNIYSEDGFFYSPTMYVRHFKCAEYPRNRSLNPLHRCCNLPACKASDLEKLLRAHGCHDRFWDANAGADQPEGACGLPPAIIALQQQAEATRREQAEQARLRTEAKARRDAAQADLDADAAAQQRRDEARQKTLEEHWAAEAAAKEKQRQADERDEQRRWDALEAEAKAHRDRRKKEFSETQEEIRLAAEAEERRKKKKGELRTKQLREEARIAKGTIQEKKALLDSAAGYARQLEYAGFPKGTAGKVLGEIEG